MWQPLDRYYSHKSAPEPGLSHSRGMLINLSPPDPTAMWKPAYQGSFTGAPGRRCGCRAAALPSHSPRPAYLPPVIAYKLLWYGLPSVSAVAALYLLPCSVWRLHVIRMAAEEIVIPYRLRVGEPRCAGTLSFEITIRERVGAKGFCWCKVCIYICKYSQALSYNSKE